MEREKNLEENDAKNKKHLLHNESNIASEVLIKRECLPTLR